LPQIVETRILAEFNKQEIMDNPEKVLMCVLEAKIMGKGSSDFKIKSRELPEESEALKLMKETNIFKRENPS